MGAWPLWLMTHGHDHTHREPETTMELWGGLEKKTIFYGQIRPFLGTKTQDWKLGNVVKMIVSYDYGHDELGHGKQEQSQGQQHTMFEEQKISADFQRKVVANFQRENVQISKKRKLQIYKVSFSLFLVLKA